MAIDYILETVRTRTALCIWWRLCLLPDFKIKIFGLTYHYLEVRGTQLCHIDLVVV